MRADGYTLTHDTDPEIFKDDFEALWIFADALLRSCHRGTLAALPGAQALAAACVQIKPQIEQAAG